MIDQSKDKGLQDRMNSFKFNVVKSDGSKTVIERTETALKKK